MRHPFHKKTWRAAWQSAVIVILAAFMGLLWNAFRTDPLPLVADWSPEDRLKTSSGESLIVSLEDARSLCTESEAVFLDARSPEEYARGHIRCAQNIPWQSFDDHIDRVWGAFPDDAWIVTYCDGEQCSLSEDLARELMAMGYRNVKVLVNGWTRWREAGLPIGGEQSADGSGPRGNDAEGAEMSYSGDRPLKRPGVSNPTAQRPHPRDTSG